MEQNNKGLEEKLKNEIKDEVANISMITQFMIDNGQMEVSKYIYSSNPEDFANEIVECAKRIKTMATTLNDLYKVQAKQNGTEYKPYEVSIDKEELENGKAVDSVTTSTPDTNND